MSFTDFFILIGIFIAMMVLYKRADKWVQKLAPETVKKINWIGFAMGIAGGILWYAFAHSAFMVLTLAGVVIYFLFYGYDKMEEDQQSKNL